MKRLLFIILIIQSCVYGQKPPIDSVAIKNWPTLSSAKISHDGKYFMYLKVNVPSGSETLVIQSTGKSQWKREFIGVSNGEFLDDNKIALFQSHDTLFLLSLGTDDYKYVANIRGYQVAGNWLAYQLNNSSKEFILDNMVKGRKLRYTSVRDYYFNRENSALVIRTEKKAEDKYLTNLEWVDLEEEERRIIWSSNQIIQNNLKLNSVLFDHSGTQVVFLVQEKVKDQLFNTIWYFKNGMEKAKIKVSDSSIGINPLFSLSSSVAFFSRDGRFIYFKLEKKNRVEDNREPTGVAVDVWSYKDLLLQSSQLQHQSERAFFAGINVEGDKAILLEGENETFFSFSRNGDLILLHDRIYSQSNSKASPSYYLFSVQNQSKSLIVRGQNICNMAFSSDDKFLVYFDKDTRNYFSYEIKTGKTRNISKNIPVQLCNQYVKGDLFPVGIAGWLDKDSALFVYDEFDIWQVDPLALEQPKNVTNGFGRKNHIRLVLLDQPGMQGYVIQHSDSLFLTAFNIDNKNNGLYLKSLNNNENPKLLSMGPYIIYINTQLQTPDFTSDCFTMRPLKARNSNVWVVERKSYNIAPNYYLTTDFKKFQPLTDVHPQKNYNWLTAELITWKQLDGTWAQGILYKPEDFSPQKRYPIIFNYYEHLSFSLNAFLTPGYVENEINIPWFVSRGYLVFRPDIYFSIAKYSNKVNGENAYNAIVSAANHLSKFPWVNNKKMGLNGHSFGGGITNYLIANTNIFSAAVASAGVSDAISANLSLGGPLGRPDYSRLSGTVIDQGRMGVNIWQRPDLYIRYSAIFKAHKITTPLLLMHNMADPAVPWAQSVELFLALRYLNKKVWMLQYDNGTHSVAGKDAIDYTIRVTQFFDHFLKDSLPPKWMTEGVPARDKGVNLKYDLDKSGHP